MKVTAIVGSYRKGGASDQAVDAILEGAREAGATVSKIYLIDRRMAFCANCRECMQEPGPERGRCPIHDDVPAILDEIDASDAVVLASPVNFGTVTAVMKQFIERLGAYAYWPWGAPAPKPRRVPRTKRAVVVASSAAPALLARFAMPIVGLLKKAADVMGARTVGVLFIGLAAQYPGQPLDRKTLDRARRLGRKLVTGRTRP
ncbi:MAG: flavodoxin family protein [Thiohalomonadaceae bacterium]